MTPPFRFSPPRLRPGLLLRRQLLGRLAGRWERRLTVVVGGPGLGKTTLLAQAVAENRLSPRGEDVWLGCEASDADDEHLASGLLAALGVEGRPGPDWADAVAEVVWLRSPDDVCLVLDDLHALAPASPGLELLDGLLEVLPANARLLIGSRARPKLSFARLAAQGEVAELDEAALRFSPEEVEVLAGVRQVDARRLRPAGGWPAMVELAATAEGAGGTDFLWQEVLDPLGADRRRVLAAVVDLGGADDALASSALGAPVALDEALAGVPLVDVDDRGWHAPHPLWATAPALGLDDPLRAETRRRAAHQLVDRGRLDRAFELLAGAGLWQDVPLVLVRDCAGPFRHQASQLRSRLDRCPASVVASPAGRLAQGVLARLVEPGDAEAPLREAWSAFVEEGNDEGELAAVVNLGHLAWWKQDYALLAELAPRVDELAGRGHATAVGLSCLGRALLGDIAGDSHAVLAELDALPAGSLGPEWAAIVGWLRAMQLYALGDLHGALAAVEGVRPGAPPLFRLTLDATRLAARFRLGLVDEVLAEYPELLAAAAAGGAVQNLAGWAAEASRAASHVGDLAAAEGYLRQAGAVAHRAQAGARVKVGLAEASLATARGDEAAAAAALRELVERLPPATGTTRRAWLDGLALAYVVAPEARRQLAAMELGGCWLAARDLAAALTAAREGRGDDALSRLALPLVTEVRGALHHRLAAELAAALQRAGRDEGAAVLHALGAPGRQAVRALAERDGRGAGRAARSLLAAVPAPPAEAVRVLALGPMELRRGGRVVTDPDWRRQRVRELLGFLVTHRRVRREAVTAALWPEHDEPSAANNLRFTLACLLRVLEPGRREREAAFSVRQEGPLLRLVAGHLSIDADDFDRLLDSATATEAEGAPSAALADYLGAAALYRQDYLADLADAEWAGLPREHYRARFVRAAVRAGQLLMASGDLDPAEDLARRALDAEGWSEDAYALLAHVWLARGDRAAARRSLECGVAMLADLGLEPSEATRRVERRLA